MPFQRGMAVCQITWNLSGYLSARVGERAGSGVPDIFSVWENEGWVEPRVEEQYKPDRTTLILSFEKRKQAIKTSDKKQAIKVSDKKQAIKTLAHINGIKAYLERVGESGTSAIAEEIGLSQARTRKLLSEMLEVEGCGSNRNRTYRLKKDE